MPSLVLCVNSRNTAQCPATTVLNNGNYLFYNKYCSKCFLHGQVEMNLYAGVCLCVRACGVRVVCACVCGVYGVCVRVCM